MTNYHTIEKRAHSRRRATIRITMILLLTLVASTLLLGCAMGLALLAGGQGPVLAGVLYMLAVSCLFTGIMLLVVFGSGLIQFNAVINSVADKYMRDELTRTMRTAERKTNA